jgi:hypothetical protein
MRTLRPMLGVPAAGSRWHIVSGAALLLGALVAALGAVTTPPLLAIGAVVAALGAVIYAGETFARLRRATTPHLVPRAFVAGSLLWLVLAAAAAVAAVLGAPCAEAAVVLALAGWLGQMVNAHLHHLGARLLATLVRGDDDETPPWEVLTPQLGWLAFVSAQLAVACTAWRSLGGPAASASAGGAAGLLAVAAMLLNAARARRRLV